MKNEKISNGKYQLFLDDNKLSKEQLIDPDYRVKEISKSAKKGDKFLPLYCSKCHHCR